MRILSIFGTRPEAVKMAPVVKALQSNPAIESIVCVTAQHREMLDQVLILFRIIPDIDLNLMQADQTLAGLTAAVFQNLDPVLVKLQPDWILVQGDTTTVMAASLLGYYHKIHVGHVEAGLRTKDKWQPFPEEINRRIAGVIADLHFAPTEWSRQNLLAEGIPDQKITVTGNPVIDALMNIAKRPIPVETTELLVNLGVDIGTHASISRRKGRRLIVITAHRRENFGLPLENICRAIISLADHYGSDVQFVYPVHLNPHVQEPVYRLLGAMENITLLPPMDYLPLIHLIKHATLVLTDSGGIQEEAPGLGVPVLVLRAVTERPEGIEAGTVRLVGTDHNRIISETKRLLDNPGDYAEMANAVNPYGDGHAAERVVQALLGYRTEGNQA